MKHILPAWIHQPGVHCASTALSDTMSYRGHHLSEAMCFGLGAGLGFAYLESELLSPTRLTAVRSRLLEPNFFENIGWPFSWRLDPDPQHALQVAKEFLLADTPLLLHADICHLPHYNTKTHFPGHVIALWGFDDEEEIAFISDTGWDGLLSVPYSHLNQARYDGTPFMKTQGDYYPVPVGLPLPDLKTAGLRALRKQGEDLFGLKIDIPGVFGFEGMKRAEQAMKEWEKARDWNWCARWFYQVIERRGTGGGAFRKLYSRFLAELADLAPRLATIAPAEEMQAIAETWTELAFLLKELSDQDSTGQLPAASQLLTSIREREEKFFEKVLQAIPPVSA